ncbi:hypothetical protein D9619_009996 [Psilocybe cf. subviscida]|uniref:Uncharacterized protein n=1 Tax=Psilocybe cf. subviscida TaxID=2480587 RepID=A0A8H5BLZ9_9AGAR|nr:hypothetical protein D9619_009996 [Psilocybe cf. subviscida]
MRNKKTKIQDASLDEPAPPAFNGLDPTSFGDSLSNSSYISIVGVHTTLWLFVALYLPRTKYLNESHHERTQTSSRDRPQHPFLQPLTADPTVTLLFICGGALILQGWWAGWTRDWWLQLGLRGSKEDRQTELAALERHKMTASRNAWLATFAASFTIHFLLVLFGAPITSLVFKTYLLALLLSIMTVYAPAYSIGTPTFGSSGNALMRRWTWIRVFAEFSPRNSIERALLFPAVGTVTGSWLGIIPIALDWDRPWQAWPLTPAYGAIAGYVISSMVALTVNTVLHLAEEHAQGQRLQLKTK